MLVECFTKGLITISFNNDCEILEEKLKTQLQQHKTTVNCYHNMHDDDFKRICSAVNEISQNICKQVTDSLYDCFYDKHIKFLEFCNMNDAFFNYTFSRVFRNDIFDTMCNDDPYYNQLCIYKLPPLDLSAFDKKNQMEFQNVDLGQFKLEKNTQSQVIESNLTYNCDTVTIDAFEKVLVDGQCHYIDFI